MWTTIKEILNGDNSLQVLIFLWLVLLLLFFLVRGDILKIRTPHVKIGVDERERAIIRQQTEWTYQYVTGLYGIIKEKYPIVNPLATKYILERVYDEIVVWIMFNHISRSDMYIMVKAEKLQGLVYAMDVHEVIRTEEFAKIMAVWTKEIINRLVDIREYYSK